MRYLADACALITYFSNKQPEQVMPEATLIMRERDIGVLPSTVLEICIKAAIGKLPAFWDPWPSLSALLSDQEYRRQETSWEDAEAASNLPDLHKNPMDRLLIATALRADMTVITSDRIFRSYNVKTVW